jgi:hypothetical protein
LPCQRRVLHPGADERDELAGPEQTEVPVPQRAEERSYHGCFLHRDNLYFLLQYSTEGVRREEGKDYVKCFFGSVDFTYLSAISSDATIIEYGL